MPKKISKTAARKPRTDALRNRERILEAAQRAFRRHGADATMDEIGKQAGVGPGTLYRHFPTRDALLEAVYQTEVEKLAAAERQFAKELPPLDALRAWMLLFIEHMETKTIIAPALNTIVGGAPRLYASARGQIYGAMTALVERAIKSGAMRKEIEPADLLLPLIGSASFAAGLGSSAEWGRSSRRLVDILIAGSRR